LKGRPRSIERKTAEHLTAYFATIGASPIYRVPVIGRTGPDLDVNEVGLVIDVKSRLEIPVKYMKEAVTSDGELLGVPLWNIDVLLWNTLNDLICQIDKPSKIVRDYYWHMEEWTVKNSPGDISAIVLHRPKMPTGKSKLFIHQSNLEKLKCRIQTIKSLQSQAPI